MAQNTKNTQHSRRGFFQSLLGDFTLKKPAETAEQRTWKTRASVLALKYGKNEAMLAKIGVRTPVLIQESQFRVDLTGLDATGKTHRLELEVDAESGVVRRFEPEINPSQGNSES